MRCSVHLEQPSEAGRHDTDTGPDRNQQLEARWDTQDYLKWQWTLRLTLQHLAPNMLLKVFNCCKKRKLRTSEEKEGLL